MTTIQPLQVLASQVVANEIIRDPVPYVQHMGMFRSTPLSFAMVRMTSVYGYVLPPGYYWKIINSAGYYVGIGVSNMLMINPDLNSETITYPGYRVLSVVPDLSQQLMCVVLENYKGYYFNIVKGVGDKYIKSETIHSSSKIPIIAPAIRRFEIIANDRATSYGFDSTSPPEPIPEGVFEFARFPKFIVYHVTTKHPISYMIDNVEYPIKSRCMDKSCLYVCTGTENILINESGVTKLAHQRHDYMAGPSIVRNQGKLFFCKEKQRLPIRGVIRGMGGIAIVGHNNCVYFGQSTRKGMFVYQSQLRVEEHENGGDLYIGQRYCRYRNKYYVMYGSVGEIKDPKGIMAKLNDYDIYCDDTDPDQQYIINPGNGYTMYLHEILSIRLRLVEL